MTLSLHTLAPKNGAKTKKFRIGRGLGSGRGKTSGRGTKGQRSRTGGRNKLAMLGMRSMVLSFPKLGGFRSRAPRSSIVHLSDLNRYENGEKITRTHLEKDGLLSESSSKVKIVGGGVLEKILHLEGIAVTASVKKSIEAKGGTVRIESSSS